MADHRIWASARINAPPQEIYEVIADYQNGHPRILPRPPFVTLDVEHGGRGAGTVIRVGMRVLGQHQTFRAVITEPQPGRVLVETNDTGYITTFTVEPRDGGRSAEVTISTEMPRRSRVRGALERWFMWRFLRPVFTKELELLATISGAAPQTGDMRVDA